jgi:hypothetical protein
MFRSIWHRIPSGNAGLENSNLASLFKRLSHDEQVLGSGGTVDLKQPDVLVFLEASIDGTFFI